MNTANQFEAIIFEHYEPLFRFAISLTRAESDARDLTQQTFYIWATKGHQLRDSSKVKPWLFTTLHRVFLTTQRRQSRFVHEELDAVSDQLPVHYPECADQADGSAVLPALAQVDKIYQAAVALFYLEDYSYKDIATILEVPVGTVKSRIARGIAQLREILLSDGSGDSTLNQDEIFSITNKDKSAIPPENTLPLRGRHAPFAAGAVQHGYDEWAFSATPLREPHGAF